MERPPAIERLRVLPDGKVAGYSLKAAASAAGTQRTAGNNRQVSQGARRRPLSLIEFAAHHDTGPGNRTHVDQGKIVRRYKHPYIGTGQGEGLHVVGYLDLPPQPVG